MTSQDANSWKYILLEQLLIGSGPGNTANSCLVVLYNVNGGQAYLMDDASTQWMGPISLGSPGTVSNHQCTIDSGGSSMSTSGNNWTFNLSVSFAASGGFPSNQTENTYVAIRDQAGHDSGWLTAGTWTVGIGAPSVHIDMPAPGGTVSGIITVAGWAIDNATTAAGTAIGSMQVKVDGVAVGSATYGVNRPDVCNAYPGRPGCPNVGFSYQLNTATLSPGSHTITVTATDTDGNPDVGSASVTISVTSYPPSVHIDAPQPNAVVSGTVAVTGWALDNSSLAGGAISSVQVKVDGVSVGNATYGANRPDVCNVYPGRPGCPNVGFSYQWNTAALSAGSHTIHGIGHGHGRDSRRGFHYSHRHGAEQRGHCVTR